MLADPKDIWNAPKISSASRFSSMENQYSAKRILDAQLVYSHRVARNLSNIETTGNLALAGKLMLKTLGQPLSDEFLIMLQEQHLENAQRTLQIVCDTIGSFGLKPNFIREAQWGVAIKGIAKSKCYILCFTTVASNHAIAVYRTSGVASTDYYIFDPNFGEYKCEGEDDAQELLGLIRTKVKIYGNPKTITLWQVAL